MAENAGMKDREISNVVRATSADYLKHFLSDGSTADQSRETRCSNYQKLVNEEVLAFAFGATQLAILTCNSYYDNYTDFALGGWGQSFHFCRYNRGREPMAQAIARHEHFMAHILGLKEGMVVLDLGCGVGGPAKEIAAFVGCKVVGLNINEYQIELGRAFAKRENVGEEVVKFVHGDFMKIPFADNTFDAIYAMDATVHAPSLEGVYAEACRVLKPGGRFVVYEWVMTDKFDGTLAEHEAIRSGIERGNGIASLRTAAEAQSAMEKAFVVEIVEDLGLKQDALPWWYVCSGDTKYASTWGDWGGVVRMTGVGRIVLGAIIRALEFTTIARQGSAEMVHELALGGDNIGRGGELGIFTPMFLMVGIKSEKEP